MLCILVTQVNQKQEEDPSEEGQKRDILGVPRKVEKDGRRITMTTRNGMTEQSEVLTWGGTSHRSPRAGICHVLDNVISRKPLYCSKPPFFPMLNEDTTLNDLKGTQG